MDTIEFGDVKVLADDSHIGLDTVNKQFTFKLKSETSLAEGYCDLTDEEYAVFDAVFKRMVNNVERVD